MNDEVGCQWMGRVAGADSLLLNEACMHDAPAVTGQWSFNLSSSVGARGEQATFEPKGTGDEELKEHGLATWIMQKRTE